MPFIVVYDANVLVGNTQRDLLIRIARTDLVQAKWTSRILDEVMSGHTEEPAEHSSREAHPAEGVDDRGGT